VWQIIRIYPCVADGSSNIVPRGSIIDVEELAASSTSTTDSRQFAATTVQTQMSI